MKPVQASSRSSNYISEDLYSFLSNSIYRKKYNNLLNLTKKFRNNESKIEYLKICIEEKLISTDFNFIKPKLKHAMHASVKEASIAASLELMKVALEEN